jgi:DNA-binding beta-propeller fold protein YncE
VYVANVGAPGPGTPPTCSVSVISGESNGIVRTIPAGDEPTAFCYSRADRRIYWVNEWSHDVAIVDAATDVQVGSVPLGTSQVQPVDIAYNPVNRVVYTANRLTFAIGVLGTGVLACPPDLDRSGAVDGGDLSVLLGAWGTPFADLDGDDRTDGYDLGILLSRWGPC